MSAVNGPWRNAAPRLASPKTASNPQPQGKKGTSSTPTASTMLPAIETPRLPQRSERIPPKGALPTATTPPSMKTQPIVRVVKSKRLLSHCPM